MFKTPEWEDDVPSTNTSFMKISQKKKKSSPKSMNKTSFKVNKLNGKSLTKAKTKLSPKRINKEDPSVKVKSKVSVYKSKDKNISKDEINNKSRKRKLETKPSNTWDKEPKPSNTLDKKPKPSNTLDKKPKPSNTLNKKPKQSVETQIPETQNFDEILLNAKKQKINEIMEKDDKEDMLFTESKPKKKKNKHNQDGVNSNSITDNKNVYSNRPFNKKKLVLVNDNNNMVSGVSIVPTNKKKKKARSLLDNQSNNNEDFNTNSTINNNKNVVSNVSNLPSDRKKNRLRTLLDTQNNRRHINVDNKSNKLRERMLERLKAAQFRYLNEKLYTSSGSEAQQLFKEDPAAFETYHQGYQLQVKKWPINPLDVIVKKIMKMPKTHLITDMGCGEAALSRRIPHTVRSFDLVATAPGVEACDMARTPLLSASMDVAVYCLALMGTDLTQYLVEANRVLKMGGHLLIAEVESRFDNVESFTKEVQRLGFKLKQLDKSNKVFYFMEFTKVQEPPTKKAKLPVLTLKPCIYKRR